MNNKRPAQAPVPNEKQKPAESPNKDTNTTETESLPKDHDLDTTDPMGLTDPDEKMKRLEREAELNKVRPEPENNIGPDTVGVGQPTLQPVNQGGSLPQSAIPVEKRFEGQKEDFYDPHEAERAARKAERAARGGKKTTGLEEDQ